MIVDSEEALLQQQDDMTKEFRQGVVKTPMEFDHTVEQFVVPAIKNLREKIVSIPNNACAEVRLIFSALYTAYYLTYILNKGAHNLKVSVSSIVPRFILFLSDIEITVDNKVDVLKLFEAHRVKNDGVKTQSTGLKDLLSLLNLSLNYELFGGKTISNTEYRYLDILTKTKVAPDDDIEQCTLTSWFGYHSWLRTDNYGIGNHLFNRVASPKLLIQSFRITVETGLLELHHAKHKLINLFKELNVTRLDFPTLEAKPLAKDYNGGAKNSEFKKNIAQHKKATLNYKRELFNVVSSLVHQSGKLSNLSIAIDALIYAECPQAVISSVKEKYKTGDNFSQQATLNGKVETVFKQDVPQCLLFTANFLMELVDFANNINPEKVVPTSLAENYLFSSLMAYQTVAVSDIFRLRLSDFKFLKRQSNKIAYLECDYFKSRASAVHRTKMVDMSSVYGEAIMAFINDRTSGRTIHDSLLVNKYGIQKFKLGSSSRIAVLFRFLAESSFRVKLDKRLLQSKSSPVFVDGVNKVLSLGIKRETYTYRNNDNADDWLITCKTPCMECLYGLSSVKNTSIHAQSDSFDPTQLENYHSHTNETKRSNYLNEANQTWQNNCGRITRAVMHDIQANVLRPSQSEAVIYQSDFTKATTFIEQRKNDTLARIKVVTEKEHGRVDALGFDTNRVPVEGELPDSLYLIESAETVMKHKHYLAELERKHLRLFQNAPDFLFYTALPTAEWIEAIFSQRLFSREVLLEGENMYKKFRDHLPQLFVAQTGEL